VYLQAHAESATPPLLLQKLFAFVQISRPTLAEVGWARAHPCPTVAMPLFEPDVGDAIREACEYNDITDGMCIVRAARILYSDLFGDFPKFDGSLSEGFCPENSTPPSLVSFLTTMLGGYNIDGGSPMSSSECTAACSIAQLIRFSSVK